MDTFAALALVLALAAAVELRHRRPSGAVGPTVPPGASVADPRHRTPRDADAARLLAELRAAAQRDDSAVRRVASALGAAGSAVPFHAAPGPGWVRPPGPTGSPRSAR